MAPPRARLLVVVTVSALHPARRGNQVRTGGLLSHLSDGWRVESFAACIQPSDLPLPRRKVQAGPRWIEERLMDPLIWAWVFVAARLGRPGGLLNLALGLLPRRRIRRALARADVVMVEQAFLYAWVRAATPASIPVVLDEHEVRGGERETHAVGDADLVLTPSPGDTERALGLGATRALTVPNATDTERIMPASPEERLTARRLLGLDESATLAVFVGSAHAPNLEAVQALEARAGDFAAAGIQLLLVGRSSGRRRHSDGVVYAGEVPDVLPYLRAADIALCPLRSGGGTSLKVMEAMAAGLPLLSTPAGVRGLPVRDGVEVVVCEINDMPHLAAGMLNGNHRAAAMSLAARRLVEEQLSWRVVGGDVSAILDELVRT